MGLINREGRWHIAGVTCRSARESAREMSLIGIANHECYFRCRMFTGQHQSDGCRSTDVVYKSIERKTTIPQAPL